MGVTLKQARLDRGISQAEAARRLGLHQSQISRMESGKRRVSLAEAMKLAKLYNVKLEEICP